MNEDDDVRIEPTLDPNLDAPATPAASATQAEAARQQAELAAARGEVEALRRRHAELLEQVRAAQADAAAARRQADTASRLQADATSRLQAEAAAREQASAAPEPAAAQPAAANDAADPAALQELEALKARHAELNEQLLRAQAEMQNVRRRSEEEMSKARKFAIESFAETLLPVADSLEAGLAIQEATPQQIREGAEATLRQLKSALERNKVMEINPAAGSRFDPHQHQAISMVPAPEGSQQEANTIVAVLQKGYLIAERVLRPALVTVAAPR